MINIKNPVFKIKVVQNGLIYVLDTLNTLRIFDDKYNLQGGVKIKMSAHKPFENTADISSKGTYLAIAEGKKTYIWDIKAKKNVYKFGWHKGNILNVSFDQEENYLLSAGDDGRAYIWNLKFGRMLLALPPHPDYILSGGFSKNNLWAATGSYDRLITVTNIPSPNINFRKKSHRGAVGKIKFFEKNIMVSGDKTGEIIKWDFRKGKVLNRFSNMADMVVDFDSDEKNEYLFAVTKEKRVYLYNFETGELISQDFIKLSAFPTVVCYDKNTDYLYVGCVDGSLYIFNLMQNRDKLQKAIKNKKYNEAYELIKQNPILKRTKEYEELENIWGKTLNAINKLLEKGKTNEAKNMFAPFSSAPLKRSMFQSMLKDYCEFEKFKNAVLNYHYPLAYSLIRMHPVFKQSVYYKKMENDFKKVLNKARELIKIGREAQAKDLFKPFRGVSEKSALIQSIFNEKTLYDMLKNKFVKKEFDDFFAFVKKYPFLTDTPEYEMALKYADNLKNTSEESIKKGEYKKALIYARLLKQFPMYKKEAEEILKKVENISNFLMYMAEHNYDMVEKLVNKYPYLEKLDDYKKFLEEYKKRINVAEQYALEGNMQKLKESFKDLIKYESFKNLMTELSKRIYLNQIISLYRKKDFDRLSKSIKNYIAFFGFDNEIGDILKSAKKNGIKITLESYEKSLDVPFESFPDHIWDIEF